jgi:amino acid adenylation domain-containing protein
MLVLRSDLSGNPTFLEMLAQVRAACLEAYAHQDLPFEKLVEELQPERTLSHNPLFQATFTLQNTPTFCLNLAGLTANELEVDAGIARFDLHLFMEQAESGLRGWLDYNADLFDGATIFRMVDHFQVLLEGVVADPALRVGDVSILAESEKHRLLVEWNDTGADFPNDKCIHELFEAQVERSPDTVAVVFENEQLTYRELNGKANQVAHYLQAQGVGPEVLVGICVERSLEMIVGLLGILKAGGVYVPLDPAYPQDRLKYMLQDAQAVVLLTQQRLLDKLFAGDSDPRFSILDFQLKVVCLDELFEDRRSKPVLSSVDGMEDGDPRSFMLDSQLDGNFDSGVTAGNLAYVIYTSGSTGRPKGVMNSHGGICNRLLWMQEEYKLTDNDHVLQKTSFGFDVSVWELFWPLITGARLIMARPGGHLDPAYLVEVISEQRISVLHFVPAMLQVFLEYPGVEHCHSVRQVICSGEKLSYELQAQFFKRLRARLANLYGPTEAAVDVTSWPCTGEGPFFIVPIGRPIANTQIYILDAKLQPVPIGIPGELYIGGVQLARGYLSHPDLTAENFIPNPFEHEPGARLYRTGDQARYLSDGNIEFLGRVDHQVKIRGFRIELGEIESVLSQHPAVREAVVVAREDEAGDKRLTAYVVTGRSVPSAGALRSFLKQKLPDYMVPSAFIFLASLPLTANGKIDRGALPDPAQDRAEFGSALAAPQTPIEKLLAKTWAEVLKLAKSGVHDNFFELGGHSLLATRLIYRLRDVFHVELLLRDLFERPTVAGLAERIEALLCAEELQATDEITGEREEIVL